MVSIFYERGVRKIEDVYIDFKNGQGPYISDTQLNQLQKLIKQEILQKLQLTFPVGSTYITQQNTNPNTILGFGTWERLKGRVTVGLDEDDEDRYFDEIGKEGGEKKHALSSNELPVNNIQTTTEQSGGAPDGYIMRGSYNPNGSYDFGGSGSAINITQPYRVVGYMWIRTE